MPDIDYVRHYSVKIPVSTPSGPPVELEGNVAIPANPSGMVVFAHGSGSSRFSPRNRFVARQMNEAGLGTLLFDLLTAQEEESERWTRHLRFDIDLLAARLEDTVRWLTSTLDELEVGLIGSSTGAAAALVAAARWPRLVKVVVSRGGRPDLAGDFLPLVRAPTLFIVGSEDHAVLELNREAASRMTAPTEIRLVAGATHLFEEPGTLELAAQHATEWFRNHLVAPRPRPDDTFAPLH